MPVARKKKRRSKTRSKRGGKAAHTAPRAPGRASAPVVPAVAGAVPADPSLINLYDGVVARSSARILKASRAGRDITPVPEIEDRDRRDAAFASLLKFLETYFPLTFPLAWSDDHLQVIDTLQRVICGGGQFALAMPRGSGKTSIVERAALWALITGRRKFAVTIGANESLAAQSLGRIKSELEHNELLLADWPKAAYPIHRLESESKRCNGQLCDGVRTAIVWQKNRIVLPTMTGPDNEASGALLHVAGLTGAVRGLSHVNAEGRTIRPDLLLIDDPQDRESARSVTQTADRLALLNGDLLGLAGPGQKIAAVTTCTVIYKGDLSDQLLNREKSPAWQGQRFKMVNSFPSNTELWDEYMKIRAESLRARGNASEATTFYRKNRAAMDAGASVSWEARKNDEDLSAIQHAMNLRQDRKDPAFFSEFQNEPLEDARETGALDAEAIATRCNGFDRGIAPPEVEKVTAFIDCGPGLLWWMVCGWTQDFGCSILDYGAWPGQRARVFLTRNASPTLEQAYPNSGGNEAAIYAGLGELVAKLFGTTWTRSDGASIPLSRTLIDAGYATDLVKLFIRQSPLRVALVPSKGQGIGPAQTAIADWQRKPGEKIGDGWIYGKPGPDGVRLLRFDTNHWKSRVADMLTRPMGSRGITTISGRRAIDHEMLSLHLSSEYPTRTEARGNAVNVWNRLVDRENHFWDCLVGNTVAASYEGLSPLASIGGNVPVERRRKKYTQADLRPRR